MEGEVPSATLNERRESTPATTYVKDFSLPLGFLPSMRAGSQPRLRLDSALLDPVLPQPSMRAGSQPRLRPLG